MPRDDKKISASVPRPFTEFGATGLQAFAGEILEEPLPLLRGERGRKLLKEMAENDPMVGAVLFTIDMLCRQVPWRVEPVSEDKADEEAKDYLESIIDDMSHSWSDFISEVLTMLTYGWSWGELVFKKRLGWQRDPSKRSRHNDGRIGLRKVAFRSQDSLNKWEFDDEGGIEALVQRPAPTYEPFTIPITKSLLFRTSVRRGNPEGRSILRSAYRPWYFKKRIEEYEAIRTERDATGIAVAWVPPEMLRTDAASDVQTLLTNIKKIVRNIKFNEQAGLVFPLEYDDKGNKKYDLTLLNANVNRPALTRPIIEGKNKEIAMSMLADVILLGHEKVGSYSLASSKTTLFATALGAFLDGIQDVLNRHLVPRLFALNAWDVEELPEFVHGDIEMPDLQELADWISKTGQAGAIDYTDEELENHLRELSGFPQRVFEEGEERAEPPKAKKPEPGEFEEALPEE